MTKRSRQTEPKPRSNPRSGGLVADTSGSSAFIDLRWRDGVAYATFSDGSQYTYEVDCFEFRDWSESESLGTYFNKFIRE